MKIQNAWRGVTNKRIYKYYKDLINFRNEGDPKEMLKSINPAETALFDAASGIHVCGGQLVCLTYSFGSFCSNSDFLDAT